MTETKLFDALGYELRQFVAELRKEEAEAYKRPRNEVAYYTTKNIRERLEELMRLYGVKRPPQKRGPEAR